MFLWLTLAVTFPLYYKYEKFARNIWIFLLAGNFEKLFILYSSSKPDSELF